jgi:branched-chain amino acid transport system substrate-binding protein
MRKIGLIVVLAILGLSLGAGTEVAAKEKEVVVGVIGGTTGGGAFLGIDALNGCLLAAEDINAAGGITVSGQKYKIRIEGYDDEVTPAKSVAGLKKLKDRYDIPVMIGHVSGSALAIMEINERMGVLWTGFARHTDITTKGNKLVLRMEVPITADTALAAKGAIEIYKAKTFTVLADTGDWGRGIRDNFTKDMEKLGAKHLATEWLDMRKDTDFRVQITKMKALNPDVVKVVAYDEVAGQITKQCREMGLMVPLVFTTGFQSKGEQIAGAKNIEGCINILTPGNFEPPPKAIEDYRAKYIKKFKGVPAFYGELTYELVWLIARGMEKADSVNDAYKIRAGMMAAAPVPKERQTAWLEGWLPNGDGILWRDIAIYKNGKKVLKDGRPASPKN